MGRTFGCICVIVLVHICSCMETKSRFISLYTNLSNTSNDIPHISSGLSPLICAVRCVSEAGCQSFSYIELTGRCRYFTAASSCKGRPTAKGKHCFYIIQEEPMYRCPVELNFTLYEEGDLCMKVGDELKSWHDAEDTCDSFAPGSRLVTLDSRQRVDLVLRAIYDTHRPFKIAVWIADVKKDNLLVRGRTFRQVGPENCWSVMLKQKAVYLTNSCSYEQGFVCEVPLRA